ncbi:unnamed protein product [Rotaria socialis]|uniref:Uncharacterized protein n=2 Tax=Rotaria socialis TaxID=392032 RepID=A0A818A8S1_9BILA|nr:unnamed protein product [Rotaria socialis]CAF3333799.1 unnamed protein product [Rotaria socialis]CAF3402074.1 unnamed protein product [Rotaria socialis]CAF3612121.1 unnamed protein product [Rotaria socialis]CAF3704527.1 unnamed protein product [Rotaria socialis]
MPLSVESEIDLLYHLSTMSEHVLPKGIFYLLLWKRLNQSSIPPAFSFNEMVDHLLILYDESVFDNPELPESQDHDFEWNPIKVEQHLENDLPNKIEPTTPQSVTKTRKRPTSPSSTTTNSDIGRRSSRQKTSIQIKEEEQPPTTPQPKIEKRKSVKDSPRISTRSIPNNDSIGTRLRGQK